MTIFNASKLTNLIKQAELDIKGGNYSLETTKESISLNILNAYLRILYAEEQVKNSEKQIESTESQLNLAAERLAMQVISQSDYAQVRSQLASERLTSGKCREPAGNCEGKPYAVDGAACDCRFRNCTT